MLSSLGCGDSAPTGARLGLGGGLQTPGDPFRLETEASRGRERDCGLEPGATGALEAQGRHLPLPARMSSSESETRTGREEERKDKMAGLDWNPTFSLQAGQPSQTTRTPLSHSCHPGPLQRKQGGMSVNLVPTCRCLRNVRWAFRGGVPDAVPLPLLCPCCALLPWNPVSADRGFPGGSGAKEPACNEGDLDLIPGSGRSPGEGNGNPLQYSCLGNLATVNGVTKS